jgi:nucleoid-associated protein YgaU
MYDLTLGGRLRCLLVGLAATGAAALTLGWTAPDLREAAAALSADGIAAQPFDRLVVWLAAGALACCAVWAWVVTGVVLSQALAGRPRAPAAGVPRWLRTAVLVACGLAVVGAGGTAHAQDGRDDEVREEHREVLAGLPPPERVLGGVRPAPSSPPEPVVHVVRSGDSLWDIAAADLGGRPDTARIAAHWHRIYRLNRTVVGPDPDLIHPGQELRMPTPPRD